MLQNLLTVATILVATVAWPQQPFDLDPSFNTHFYSARYVSGVLPQASGKVFVSGLIYTAPTIASSHGRLNHDGTWDTTSSQTYIGTFKEWGNKFYAGGVPRRFMEDGTWDSTFNIGQSPYFHGLQAGDYHVYPDGRVVIGGIHRLSDTLHGFNDYYCLIWFTSNGDLDTTAHHRTCAGSLDFFTELPNGQFIGSGSTSIWDGQAASNIVRFNADGSLDPSFQASVWWGQAYGFLPLPDGRVYVGGEFMIEGIPDTLNLVRFLSDGSLDPTFNNTAKFRDIDPLYPNSPPWGIVRGIYPLSETQLIVTGNFGNIDGQTRGSIALIDTSGNLLDDYFSGDGCGTFIYQPNTSQPPTTSYRVISKVVPAPDGSYYIYGAYQGYDDGTTNDTTQRFISRLYGLNVGIQEHDAGQVQPLQLAPNPSAGTVEISVASASRASAAAPNSASAAAPNNATLTIHDASGRVVWQEPWPAGSHRHTLQAGTLAPGVYVLRVASRALATAATASASAIAGAPPLYMGRLVVVP